MGYKIQPLIYFLGDLFLFFVDFWFTRSYCFNFWLKIRIGNKKILALILGIEMDTIGQRIYSARKKQGITQGDIASALGVSVNMVSKWENETGTPRQPKHIDALAKILGVSKVFLIFGEDYFDDDALSVEDKMAQLTTANKELVHKFVDLLLEHQGSGKANKNGE